MIFSLLSIPEEEQTLEINYKLIEQGADLEKCDSDEKLEELAEGIFRELMGIELAKIPYNLSFSLVRNQTWNLRFNKGQFGIV